MITLVCFDPDPEHHPGCLPCHGRTGPVGFRKTSDFGNHADSQQECFQRLSARSLILLHFGCWTISCISYPIYPIISQVVRWSDLLSGKYPKRTFVDTETDSLSTETDSLCTETDRNGPKRTFVDTETDSLSTETDSLGTETDRNGPKRTFVNTETDSVGTES